MSGDRWGSGGPDDHSTYAPIAAPTPQPDAERVEGGEVTAAVKAAAAVLRDSLNVCGDDRKCQCEDAVSMSEAIMADALDVVLPDARYAAKVEAVTEARKVISQYLATAEKWRYDRVMWAFAVMLGEIPEDTPEPGSMPTFGHVPAARLRAAETERTS